MAHDQSNKISTNVNISRTYSKSVLLWAYILYVQLGFAQSNSQIPCVFKMGEHEGYYEQLITQHQLMLLTASENNMTLAYDRWMSLLTKIEDKAQLVGFDVKGIKLWLNAFWHQDGSLSHLVFYPKPNSRNINYEEFEVFLKSICEDLRIEIEAVSPFSHYGSASFPTKPLVTSISDN